MFSSLPPALPGSREISDSSCWPWAFSSHATPQLRWFTSATFFPRPLARQAADSNNCLKLFGFATSTGDRNGEVPTPGHPEPTPACPRCRPLLPAGLRSAGRWNPVLTLESLPLEEAAGSRLSAGRPELTPGLVSAGGRGESGVAADRRLQPLGPEVSAHPSAIRPGPLRRLGFVSRLWTYELGFHGFPQPTHQTRLAGLLGTSRSCRC